MVDMDPQFNANKGLGIDMTGELPSVYDLIMSEKTIQTSDVIINTQWDGLDIIPSNVDLAGSEIELADRAGRENRLKYALEGIAGDYDFILLDTPPSLSLLTVNVFACAGEVIIPCQTHPYAFEALEELFDTIYKIRENINHAITVTGIVATLFDIRTRVSHSILEKLKNHEVYKKLLFNTVIRINTTIAESAAVGKPVVFYRQSSYGAADYTDLAEELLAWG